MKHLLVVILLFWWVFSAQSVERISIPKGGTVKIDGRVVESEWQDAKRFDIDLSYGKVTVLIKHDGERLQLGFVGFTPEMGLVPEVFIDTTDYDTDVWENGMEFTEKQWWFHVSGSDCWNRGRYNTYNTCQPEHDQWQANNFESMDKPPEIVEFSIPFAVIEKEKAKLSRIALAFTDARQRWVVWPQKAQLGIPRTWAKVELQ